MEPYGEYRPAESVCQDLVPTWPLPAPFTPYIVGVVGMGPGLTWSGPGLYLRTVWLSRSQISSLRRFSLGATAMQCNADFRAVLVASCFLEAFPPPLRWTSWPLVGLGDLPNEALEGKLDSGYEELSPASPRPHFICLDGFSASRWLGQI